MRVIVVGGGAVGLCVAEALSERGGDVLVLEAGRVGAGASAGNAGWITPSLSIPLPAPGVITTALRWLGRSSTPLWIRPTLEPAMLDWLTRFLLHCRPTVYRRSLATLQSLAAAAGAAFDRLSERGAVFERHDQPMLYPAFHARELAGLRAVAGDLRRAVAASPLHELSPSELRELEPALSPVLAGGMIATHESRVRPETLTRALHQLLAARGVRVLEGRPALSFARSRRGWVARTPGGEISADRIVLANGVASRRLLRKLGVHLPVVTAKGYSRTFARSDDLRSPRGPLYLEAPKVAVSVFDHAVRISGTLELGARRLDLARARLEAITAVTREALPGWAIPTQGTDWAGMRSLSPDGLPYIGPVPGLDGLHVATAHATLGITLAPLTGELLADLILDRQDHPLRIATDPARAARRLPPGRRRPAEPRLRP